MEAGGGGGGKGGNRRGGIKRVESKGEGETPRMCEVKYGAIDS